VEKINPKIKYFWLLQITIERKRGKRKRERESSLNYEAESYNLWNVSELIMVCGLLPKASLVSFATNDSMPWSCHTKVWFFETIFFKQKKSFFFVIFAKFLVSSVAVFVVDDVVLLLLLLSFIMMLLLLLMFLKGWKLCLCGHLNNTWHCRGSQQCHQIKFLLSF